MRNEMPAIALARRQMRVSAYHLVDSLGTGLYESVGQRLMELIRNSVVASMPDPDNCWQPELAKVEILLVDRHPLAKGPALIILDHGCGLDDGRLDRYFNWLGTPLSELRGRSDSSYNGASQKGIGRLAALALNESCHHSEIGERVRHGFYLFSRTQDSGQVRLVSVIPEKAELEQGFDTNYFVSPVSPEMGPLKGMQGSFTAVVIPTPVFKSVGEISESIQWLLPRERDRMFDLTINGKPIEPPPLETAINLMSSDGMFRARLGPGDENSNGIWLCDHTTGFRVASCYELGRLLPDPLWFPDIKGEIFAPGLLRYQNTARSTLVSGYTRKGNKEWQKLLMFLVGEVVPLAKNLVERDDIKGAAADALDDVAQMFHGQFGLPDDEEVGSPITPRVRPSKPRVPRENGGGGGGGGESSSRYIAIKVRDEVYHLYRGRTLNPFMFAQVNPGDARIIFVNVRGGYMALPKNKQARVEHCLMNILTAVGKSKFPSSQSDAILFANEVRADFLRGGK